MINGKTANGSIINGQIQYETDGWRLLTLPNGITGQVFFKDNGDGTASLAGNLVFTYVQGTSKLLLTPPNGYRFSNVNWNFWTGSPTILGINGLKGSNPPTESPVLVKLQDGALYASEKDVSISTFKKTLVFTQNGTVLGAEDGNPAIIGIARI